MIIAVPVNGETIESGICASFGRAPYFLVHDTDKKSNKFVENKAAASRDGAGVRAAQTIVDQNVEILLTPRCGGNAAMALQAAKIKLYKTKGESIEENLEAFAKGELSLLEEIHAGRHDYGRD